MCRGVGGGGQASNLQGGGDWSIKFDAFFIRFYCTNVVPAAGIHPLGVAIVVWVGVIFFVVGHV